MWYRISEENLSAARECLKWGSRPGAEVTTSFTLFKLVNGVLMNLSRVDFAW